MQKLQQSIMHTTNPMAGNITSGLSRLIIEEEKGWMQCVSLLILPPLGNNNKKFCMQQERETGIVWSLECEREDYRRSPNWKTATMMVEPMKWNWCRMLGHRKPLPRRTVQLQPADPLCSLCDETMIVLGNQESESTTRGRTQFIMARCILVCSIIHAPNITRSVQNTWQPMQKQK